MTIFSPLKSRASAWAAGLTARRLLLLLAGLLVGGVLAAGIVATLAFRALPDLAQITDYKPKQPLRVYTSDGVEIGQFGTERRTYVPIGQIPKLMQDAVLAIEDSRFREHGGIDTFGVMRALVANLSRTRSQGASTITQQVARTFYLSSSKTYTRKVREMLLAMKIETQLSKEKILELYMNQIYLGQRSYGFEAAAQTYFGKSMNELTVAEAAMLAGLPQNPAYANPVTNFDRARKRQLLVLDRMRDTGVITNDGFESAKAQTLDVRRSTQPLLHAEYVAEMARQAVHAQYGEEAYTLGLKVTTSIRAADQTAAYKALRKGLLDYDRRQVWRGPEDSEDLPADAAAGDPAVSQVLADYDDDEDLRVAVVTEAGPKLVVATLASGDVVRITGDGLRPGQSGLLAKAADDVRIERGSVVRVMQRVNNAWSLAQWPEVQGAIVSMDPRSAQVRAMVGGFDFAQGQVNHVTQAWRQPGSSFKPFLYSAALEHGVMPATEINDAPLSLPAADNGGKAWNPQNSDGQFDGPMTLRRALAKSKNLVTIRLVQMLGPDVARQWASQFGFDIDKQPDNLTLALGSGATTPLQMASAYSVLANGGFRVDPQIVERVTDMRDSVLFDATPAVQDDTTRVVPERNVFVTSSLLNEVTRSGTAAQAQAQLKRPDIYGKTGTTNDAVDAWFAGFQPNLVAVVWMGYDTPRSLGSRESGGGLSLPVWIDYMSHALKGTPVVALGSPAGVEQINGDWVYTEWAMGGNVTQIGITDYVPVPPPGSDGALQPVSPTSPVVYDRPAPTPAAPAPIRTPKLDMPQYDMPR
ncbi:MAG: Peptidoglycan glycosyltransferase penicillin-binding protein [Rhizobacter sp.]|nr:Peptidoglycan glycosyltransferase penicillin-binding protein [Rhizobacter sp.]